MSEPRRWTVKACSKCGTLETEDCRCPFEDEGYDEPVEVMPVSEHEELHATAQEVVDAAAAFPRLDRYAGLAGSLDALRAVLAAGQKERGSDV